MRSHFFLYILLTVICVPGFAQTIYVDVKVKATVLDSKTLEPIPYVSVYLIP